MIVCFPIYRNLLRLILDEVHKYYSLQPYLSVLYQAIFAAACYGFLRIGEVMKKAVVIIKQPKPYIFNYFNISGHYVTIRSGISRVARLLNPFIHGLNEEAVLPKIIVIIPDADML